MPPKKLSIIWNAEPHTVAKIDILRAYLVAWFQIMGRSMPKQDILYVDGFAGPGEYLNHPEGSPLAALATAKAAFEQTGNKWIAGNVHCAFIESDSSRFEHLEHKVLSVEMPNTIVTHLYHSPFVEGLGKLRQDVPDPFKSRQPLFVFIDPFGATGVPSPPSPSYLEARAPRSWLTSMPMASHASSRRAKAPLTRSISTVSLAATSGQRNLTRATHFQIFAERCSNSTRLS
jgi:hypothetical protein